VFHAPIEEEHNDKSTRCQFHGGGKALSVSSDELLTYQPLTCMSTYQFLQSIKKNQKQSFVLNYGNIMCMCLIIYFAPKLTLKANQELANLNDMYMPSKILQKNAQILLEITKCETCGDIFAVFRPYKVASNAERQQTWYQQNKKKCASIIRAVFTV